VTAASASAGVPAGVKQVSYRGYRFEVPSAWPVISLTAHPGTCVRFDRQAVYLGTPGAEMKCPARGAGRNAGALVVQPESGATAAASVQNPVSHLITATSPGIRVTATYGTNEAQVRAILASASLPAPAVRMPRAAGTPPAVTTSAAASPARAAGLPAEAATAAAAGPAAGNFTGKGFDACAAPSSGDMRAWKASSPYSAVGIYIGGSERACAQSNLTAGWISQQAAAGWRFIPLYVGPQALYGQLSSPASQGTSAADDAVGNAAGLGLGLGTPLYYDMEGGYSASNNGAVLTFLSAWTSELHKRGYESGVYSSASAAVALLVGHYTSTAIPDVIYDADFNGQATTSDPAYIPAGDWANDQRIHQYNGNLTQTYGGVTLNIDQDYLGVRLPYGGSRQASQAAAQQSGTADAFFKSGSGGLEHTFYKGSGWSVPSSMNAGTIGSEPSVVTSAPGNVDVFWEGTDANLWHMSYTPSGGWSGRQNLKMGPLGGPPHAVAQQNGTIDVFWKGGGTNPRVWHAWQNPGSSAWGGPQDLGGSPASDPFPVSSSPGTVDVFFKGSDGNLWHVFSHADTAWSAPASLGMGTLGGAPFAAAGVSGTIDVFWKGTGAPAALWHAWYNDGHPWAGPQDLGGNVG
jgi:hypothetical protein